MSSKAWSAFGIVTCSGMTSGPAADRKHLPHCDQRLHRAGAAGRGAAKREGAVLKDRELRLAGIAHHRNPVDRVLQERRDRGIVFGACKEHAAMRHQQALEPHGVLRRPGLGPEVGVIDRQPASRQAGRGGRGDVAQGFGNAEDLLPGRRGNAGQSADGPGYGGRGYAGSGGDVLNADAGVAAALRPFCPCHLCPLVDGPWKPDGCPQTCCVRLPRRQMNSPGPWLSA